AFRGCQRYRDMQARVEPEPDQQLRFKAADAHGEDGRGGLDVAVIQISNRPDVACLKRKGRLRSIAVARVTDAQAARSTRAIHHGALDVQDASRSRETLPLQATYQLS